MCTSKTRKLIVSGACAKGARGYITKPVDPAELQFKIDALN